MAKEIIIKLLAERGKTTGHIASQLNVSYNSVYQAMNGGCSRRVRLAIAKTLNMSPSMLWAGEIKPHVLLVDDYEYMHDLKN